MTIKIYVTSDDLVRIRRLRIDDQKIISPLVEDDAVAVQMQELFSSVTEAVATSLEVESELTIEISGSLGFRVEGDAKYLFFNVGGQAEASGAMKVVLSTTIKPKLGLTKTKSENIKK